MSPLYDVNEVITVFAVSCDEKVLLLKDVFAELSRLVRNEGAISRVGFLNGDSGAEGGTAVCFPLRLFVNFNGVSKMITVLQGPFSCRAQRDIFTCLKRCVYRSKGWRWRWRTRTEVLVYFVVGVFVCRRSGVYSSHIRLI